jgi:DNA-binding transcriptional LysR family regulator
MHMIHATNHQVELRHLRYFVAVAEHGGFRRAAKRLHVTQPPLSQSIAQLEKRLDVALLVRTPAGVELTSAGESFLRDARLLLADLDRAVEAARRAGAGRTGLVRLGFVGSAAYPFVPDVISAFRVSHPGVEVRLRELSTNEQLEALAAGALDVGLARSPLVAPVDLDVEPVAREPILAALPAAHALAGESEVRLDALATEPFVMFPREQAPGFFDDLVDRVAATGTAPRIVQEAREMQTIVALVASGLGVSLVPASVAVLALPHVAYRPIIGEPVTELALVWLREVSNPAVTEFRTAAVEVSAAMNRLWIPDRATQCQRRSGDARRVPCRFGFRSLALPSRSGFRHGTRSLLNEHSRLRRADHRCDRAAIRPVGRLATTRAGRSTIAHPRGLREPRCRAVLLVPERVE